MKSGYIQMGVRSLLVLGVLLLLYAIVLLRGEAVGLTYATGIHHSDKGFDLRIDAHALYNGVVVPASTWVLKDLKPYSDKFFNIGDVKPGDFGENTISFHVNKDAWVCMDFLNLKEKENGENEPEGLADHSTSTSNGELDSGTEFFAWYDDGDDLFEVGETPIFGTSSQSATIVLKDKTYALADSKYGKAFKANTTRYIGLAWCAGDLTVDIATAEVSCDGEALGNEAQTDSFSVDVSFRAVPTKDNSKFTCKQTTTKCEWPNYGGKGGHDDTYEKDHKNDEKKYKKNDNRYNFTGHSWNTGNGTSTMKAKGAVNDLIRKVTAWR